MVASNLKQWLQSRDFLVNARSLDNPKALAELLLALSCNADQVSNNQSKEFFSSNPVNDYCIFELFVYGMYCLGDIFERRVFFSNVIFLNDLCEEISNHGISICDELTNIELKDLKKLAFERQEAYRLDNEPHLLAARFYKHAISESSFYKEKNLFSHALFASASIEVPIVALTHSFGVVLENSIKAIDGLSVEKLFQRKISLLDIGLKTNTGYGNLICWATNIVCILVAFFSFQTGLYMFFAFSAVATVVLYSLTLVRRNAIEKGFEEGLKYLYTTEEFKDYHFFIQNPQLGHTLSALMTGLRLTSGLWGLYSIFFHSLWWPMLFSVVLWFVASIVSVRLNPLFFMRDRLETAAKSEQRTLANSIRGIYWAREMFEKILDKQVQEK